MNILFKSILVNGDRHGQEERQEEEEKEEVIS
jgi:hypothetical protein